KKDRDGPRRAAAALERAVGRLSPDNRRDTLRTVLSHSSGQRYRDSSLRLPRAPARAQSRKQYRCGVHELEIVLLTRFTDVSEEPDGHSPPPHPAVQSVAGSGPFPCLNARSSARAPASSATIP